MLPKRLGNLMKVFYSAAKTPMWAWCTSIKNVLGDDFVQVLKEEFKSHFRNVTRIMDCVGCDKCRLWGKVQTTGIATALKILFELDERTLEYVFHQSQPWTLSSNDLGIALTRTQICCRGLKLLLWSTHFIDSVRAWRPSMTSGKCGLLLVPMIQQNSYVRLKRLQPSEWEIPDYIVYLQLNNLPECTAEAVVTSWYGTAQRHIWAKPDAFGVLEPDVYWRNRVC